MRIPRFWRRPTGETSDAGEDGHEAGRPSDAEKKRSLPPGARTRGSADDIDGNAGWGAPFEDAPGEGRLAPDGDNPRP